MTTLIIEIPDVEVIALSEIVKAKGGNIVITGIEDEKLASSELDFLKRGLKEALMIREGKVKSIPFSELWND